MPHLHRTTRARSATGRRWGVASVAALALVGSTLLTQTPAVAASDCSTVPWMDQGKSPADRADALLAASSQHQKYRWLVEQPANNPAQTDFQGVVYPAQLPCTPKVVYTDGPDGVRFTNGVTAFPAPISLAATWNEELALEKGDAQADEAHAVGKNVVLGPGLASGRTPLSGRTPEYFGEDPLLTGLLTAASVNGIEQDDKVLSNLKHYVANEQELDRNASSSNVDERTLREIYDLPFEIALQRSTPQSVMCSYNQLNGAYACEHPRLNEVLKDELGFEGYVVSDFGAVHSTAPSLANGLDQELNRPIHFTPTRLDAALAAGAITQEQIDEAARRVITAYIDGGLFDRPLPATPAADASTAEHKRIARTIAEQGSVLLKNDGVLPLVVEDGQTIALIGPTASSTPTGGVSASTVCSMAWRFNNAGTMNCEDLVSAEAAITERAAKDGARVTFHNGADVAAAASAAASADIAVVFGYQRMGEFSDLPDLRLAGNGDALVEAVSAANPETVVVLQTGSAVEMPWVDRVGAVLETWYAGEQQGPAIASLLFGDVNPSGKLPMTFPKSLADTPTNTPAQYPGTFADGSTTRPTGSREIRQTEYSEGLQVGYRWYEAQDVDPLFGFGHGLSYSTFEYGAVKVTPQSTDGAKEIRIRFKLSNTGAVEATETAQAYIALPSSTGEPSKRLVGWEKVTLAPGETRSVEIALTSEDLTELRLLQYWDTAAGAWTTATGAYTVSVGGSVETASETTFRIK